MGYDYIDKPLPDWIDGTLEERFTRIYRNRFWGDKESVSGPGSSLSQVKRIMIELPLLVRTLRVRSFLDIPCGDCSWMKRLDLGVDFYIGADIVEELIESNQERLGSPYRRFVKLDLASDLLPEVDFVFCRDLLVHLSFEDIQRSLSQLKQSGSTFLMCTTFTADRENADVKSGDWRPLNFQRPPFSFPPPLELINEGCPEKGYEDKSLGLWKISDL